MIMIILIETGFSTMTIIKDRFRNHLDALPTMKMKLAKIVKPRIGKIFSNQQQKMSHLIKNILVIFVPLQNINYFDEQIVLHKLIILNY